MTSTHSASSPRVTRDARLFTPAFVGLAVAELGYFTSEGVAIYTLPLFVTGPVGSDMAGAGLAFGAFAISALVLRPVAGRLADSRGRRPLLVGGALLAAASMALTAHAVSLPLILALRLMLGVAEAAFFVAAFAAVADLAPPSRLGEALSYNSLGLYLGLAFGPPLGEWLVEHWGFTNAWYGAAALSASAAVIAAQNRETRSAAPAPGTASRLRLVHRQAVPPAIGFCSSIVAIGGFLTFAALHAEAVDLQNTSLPLFVYGAVVVIGRVAFAKIPDQLPSLPLGSAALAIIAGGLSVLVVWSSPTGMLLGTVLLALGVTFSTPAFFSAIFATAGPTHRGAASATASIFMDLGLGAGPILLGFVAEAIGIPWALEAAAVVALAGCLWTLSLARSASR
jgi:predicted MFS family arabinose efflux permease